MFVGVLPIDSLMMRRIKSASTRRGGVSLVLSDYGEVRRGVFFLRLVVVSIASVLGFAVFLWLLIDGSTGY